MFRSIGRSHFVCHVVHRTSHDIQVVHHHRCGKLQTQVHRPASKGVISLSSLSIHFFLNGGILEEAGIVLFSHQAKVQQSVAHSVMTISRNQVLSFLQAGQHFARQLYIGTLLYRIACIHHLHTIDIDDDIIVVRVLQVHILIGQIFLYIYHSAYPDEFFSPLGFGHRFIFHGSESTLSCFPSRIVKAGLFPTRGWFLRGIFTFPLLLFRSTRNRIKFQFFISHESVRFSVHLQYTQQREAMSRPMLHRSII